jgi:hypothetical protein
VALEQVLGEPVVGGVLVHCQRERDAEEIVLDGWSEAVAELRAAIAR